MAIGIDVSIYAKTELLLSPLGVRIVACIRFKRSITSVTVPARGANCSILMDGLYRSAIVTVPTRGANCSNPSIQRCSVYSVTVPARGANCSLYHHGYTGTYRELQSSQGARIVADTICLILEKCGKLQSPQGARIVA